MRKPDSIAHMTVYGFVYGFLLAMIYTWILNVGSTYVNLGGVDLIEVLWVLAFIGFVLGALPGIFFGFISGCVLGFLTRRIYRPSDVIGLRQRRNLAYFIIAGFVFAGMSLLSSPVIIIYSMSRTWSDKLWLYLPIFIALTGAVYATHRYFLKLRAWGSVGKVKNKAKHGLTNQLAYDDAAEDDSFIVSQDVAQQQMRNKQ